MPGTIKLRSEDSKNNMVYTVIWTVFYPLLKPQSKQMPHISEQALIQGGQIRNNKLIVSVTTIDQIPPITQI